jgi:hypothetical protein
MSLSSPARLAALLVGAAILAGCATAEGYRQRMETFVGASGDALLVELGPPVAQDPLESGGEIWTYYREETRHDPGGYRSVPRERRITWIDSKGEERTRIERYDDTVYEPPRTWTVDCETRFVLNELRQVIDFRFIGNGCVAEEIY